LNDDHGHVQPIVYQRAKISNAQHGQLNHWFKIRQAVYNGAAASFTSVDGYGRNVDEKGEDCVYRVVDTQSEVDIQERIHHHIQKTRGDGTHVANKLEHIGNGKPPFGKRGDEVQ
jgi:hypothetical protein